MVAIVTVADLDPNTLTVVGNVVVAQDPTKAPNILTGAVFNNATALSTSDTVTQALGKLQAQTNLKIASTAIGTASGVAGLDGAGKVPLTQLPGSVVGSLNYQTVWNAATNTPPLVAGTKGRYWKVSVSGTTSLNGINVWNAGDLAIDNGTTFDKVDGVVSQVLTIAGRTGSVVLSTSDLTDIGTLNASISAKVSSSLIGAVSGVAGLDGSGKVPLAQLPALTTTFSGLTDYTTANIATLNSSVSAGLQGKFSLPANWNAATNTPTLTSGTNPGLQNSFTNTVPGTTTLGTPLDGITTLNQYDIVAFNTITGQYTKIAYAGTSGTSITGPAFSMVYLDSSASAVATAAATNGQILIGSSSANPVLGTLGQGANQGVVVVSGAGSITLSTVQDIRSSASPTFTGLTTSGATSLGAVTATSINSTPIGSGTASTAAFTTLTASGTTTLSAAVVNGTLSGTGVTALLASPGAIGSTTPGTASFTNIAATGSISGVAFSSYFASPPALGGSAPNTGKFTNLNVTGALTGVSASFTSGLTLTGSSPLVIGGGAGTAGQVMTSQGGAASAQWQTLTPSGVVATTFSTTWDMAGAKDMGDYTITAALALASSDSNSILSGFTQGTLIANGTNIPTFDTLTNPNWVNTNGARNRVKLERVGGSKYWSVAAIVGAAIAVPVAPTIGGAPNILVAIAGAGLTFTSASGVTGTPTPTVQYDVMNGATLVQANVTSGSYTPPTAGVSLSVRATATNSGGSASATSSPVTVTSTVIDPEYSVVGDSITQFGNSSFSMVTGNTANITRDTNGLITISKTTHGITGAGRMNLVNMPDNSFETIGDGVIVDANTVTIQTTVTGLPVTTALVLTGYSNSNNAALVQQYNMNFRGIWANLQSLAKGGLKFRGNWGQGGDLSTDIINAIDKACAASANFVQLMIGTNDAKAGGAVRATVVANIKTCIDRIVVTNTKTAMVCAIPPVSSGYSGYAAINALIIQINSDIQAYCNGTTKIWCDTFTPSYDGTSAAQSWATEDGIHPTPKNAKLMADAVWAQLSPLITVHDLLPVVYNGTPTVPYAVSFLRSQGPWPLAPSYATATNSGFLAGGTGTRESAPANWTGGRISGASSVAFSLVDPSDGKGVFQQGAFTSTAANEATYIYGDSTSGASLTTLGLAAGDRFIIAAEVNWSNILQGQIQTIKILTAGSAGCTGSSIIAENASTQLEGDSATKYFITGAMTVPPGATGAQLVNTNFEIRYAAASTSPGVVAVRRLTYIKVGTVGVAGALGSGHI